jgi:hypothetical protein
MEAASPAMFLFQHQNHGSLDATCTNMPMEI